MYQTLLNSRPRFTICMNECLAFVYFENESILQYVLNEICAFLSGCWILLEGRIWNFNSRCFDVDYELDPQLVWLIYSHGNTGENTMISYELCETGTNRLTSVRVMYLQRYLVSVYSISEKGHSSPWKHVGYYEGLKLWNRKLKPVL